MGVKLNEPVFALDNESTSFVIIFSFNISIISLGSLSGSTTLLVSTYKKIWVFLPENVIPLF